jgi:predicted O-linked N-acetylglucosamine transferase (SPINDLY family)
MQNLEPINEKALLETYFRKEYDQISEFFISVLEHFEKVVYYALSPELENTINVFLKHFFYIITQQDYVIGDRYITRFIQLNPTISNLVSISSFGTTDPYLKILENQANNFVKVLALYSARNEHKFDRKAFFKAESRLASLWYASYLGIYRCALVNAKARQNLVEHLAYADENHKAWHNINDVYFGATYIDEYLDRQVKQRINQTIQARFIAEGVHCQNTPNPKKIAIATSMWFQNHSVYRTLFELVDSLRSEYDLTLIHLGSIRDDLDISLFNHAKYVYFEHGSLNISSVLSNDFQMIYYPDVGMSAESILLANLRLAPIQTCGLGHSVSTFGSQIDYFFSGEEAEPPIGAENNYSERLVLLPGLGVIHNVPLYPLKYIQKQREEILINCPWYAQKVNYEHLCLLQEIIRQSSKKIIFRFFSGGALNRCNEFLPFVQDVKALLGNDYAEVFPAKPYTEYMELMEEGDFSLDSYHFGGCNVVSDSLHLHKPIVSWEGQRWYNRIGPHTLIRAGLEELVVRNAQEYVQLSLKLIHNEVYRHELQTRLTQSDIRDKIYGPQEKRYFKAAIDYLCANHGILQHDTVRTPIRIPR